MNCVRAWRWRFWNLVFAFYECWSWDIFPSVEHRHGHILEFFAFSHLSNEHEDTSLSSSLCSAWTVGFHWLIFSVAGVIPNWKKEKRNIIGNILWLITTKQTLPERLTLLRTGGGCSTPPLLKISSKTLKMASKWPQISWLFLFLYDLSEKQKKIFWFFTVILGV